MTTANKKTHLLVSITIIVFGYALTVTSVLISTGVIYRQIIEKLGLSLIVGGISYGIIKYLTTEVKESLKNEYDFKLIGSKREASPLFDEYFKKGESEIHVLGLSLNNFFSETVHPKAILEKITRGCNMKILILDPDSDILLFRAKDEKLAEDKHINNYSQVSQYLSELVDMLNNHKNEWHSYTGSIDVRLYQSLPYFSYFRSDDNIIVGLYNRGQRCETSAAIEISKTNKFFYQFEVDFWCLFERSENQKILSFTGGPSPYFESTVLNTPKPGFLTSQDIS